MLTLISNEDNFPFSVDSPEKSRRLLEEAVDIAGIIGRGRFVIIENQGELLLYLQTHKDDLHSVIAKGLLKHYPEGRLVAGGYIHNRPGREELDVEYNSSSCREKFGYDRPKDEPFQEDLLRQLAEFIRNR